MAKIEELKDIIFTEIKPDFSEGLTLIRPPNNKEITNKINEIIQHINKESNEVQDNG
jgi:hypothetical protein